jgi:hypothetical protein
VINWAFGDAGDSDTVVKEIAGLLKKLKASGSFNTFASLLAVS